MRRRRPRPKQLSLAARGGQGGYRSRAGRKAKREGEHEGHRPRPILAPRFPVHVTLRVLPGIESLRRGRYMRVLRRCFAAARDKFGFRLAHYSVQSNHLHLICEAEDRRALSRGLQGLTIRVARRLNRELGRKGQLFARRYRARILRTPAEVRNCLCYVYNNIRHHRPEPLPRDFIDDCTSARWFDGWRYPIRDMRLQPEGERPVTPATVWLLTTGWRRRGLIRFDEIPARN